VPNLANTKDIVTGAASGIGRATARLFVEAGASVLAVDRNEELLNELGGIKEITPLAIDISEKDAADRIIAAAQNTLGGLDVLMNNAGIGGGGQLAENISHESWETMLAINLTAPFRIAQAAIPLLRQSAVPRIINVASVMATHTDYGLAGYCAAKAGVTGFTRNLALELGRDGITVNAILPGAIHTGMTAASFAKEDIADIWAKKSVLRRLGQPEDIGRVALFLASADSGFITGQSINVDGGLLLRT